MKLLNIIASLFLFSCSSSPRTSSEFKDIRKNKIYFIEASSEDKNSLLLDSKIKSSLMSKGLRISKSKENEHQDKELFIKLSHKIIYNNSQVQSVSSGESRFYSEVKILVEIYEANKDKIVDSFEESAKEFGNTKESSQDHAFTEAANKIAEQLISRLKDIY